MKNRFWIAPAIIALAVGFLVFSGMKSTSLRAVPVDELRAADAKGVKTYAGQRLRVVGFVGHDPVQRTPLQTGGGTVNLSTFQIEGEKTGIVRVQYRDALPDSFRAGGPVQVDGVYNGKGEIEADHVLTKCPSKYDAVRPSIKKENATPPARRAMLNVGAR